MGEEGYTLTAACARLGIHRASFVDRLSERYPAFKELVERAQALRQAYLEEQLLRYVRAEVRGSPAAAIFALVNCNKKVGDWRHSGFENKVDGIIDPLKIEHIVRTVVEPQPKVIEATPNEKQSS